MSEKSFKNIPPFYQDMIGSLLILFSNVPEPTRFICARDICGYVEAILYFTRATNDACKYNQDTTYIKDLQKAREDIDAATYLYRGGGDAAEALEKLGAATDTMKKIIVCREMISEDFELRSNPLSSQSLEADVSSRNYRSV